MERVIFREEKNPYTKENGYLALFIDDEANPGMVECVSFCFDGAGRAIFEPLTEANWRYIHGKTSIIHKRDPLSETLLQAVSAYYETPFKMVEKLTNQGRNRNV